MDKTTLDGALAQQRSDRNTAYEALVALEEALESPVPGRETDWKDNVLVALDALIIALDEQAERNQSSDSLYSRIAFEQPRFGPQISYLKGELDELRESEQSLRNQIAADDTHADVGQLRNQLANLDARYRLLRAQETDLVYEAANVDIGGKG